MAKRPGLCLLAALAWVICLSPALSKPKISLIVDNNTPVPGGSGNFQFGTFTYPEINGGQVVFATSDKTVWTTPVDGSNLVLLLDSTTPIPKMPGATFGVNNGGWAQIVGSTVVIAGIDNNFNNNGYYSVPASGGRIKKLFDQNDAAGGIGDPDFHVNIDQDQIGELVFGAISTSCGYAAFRMPVLGGRAVEFPPLPDCSQPVPLWCCNHVQPDISGGEMVNLNTNGIGEAAVETVKTNGSAASVQMLGTSDLPGFCEQYFSTLHPQIDHGTVVFDFTDDTPSSVCPGDGNIGIVAIHGNGSVILADINTPVPGGSSNFNANCSFNQALAARDGTVVFQGCGDDQQVGLYAVSEKGGRITKVIAPGDTVAGGVVNSVAIGPEPISNGVVVFLVYVFPQYYGLYAAQLAR